MAGLGAGTPFPLLDADRLVGPLAAVGIEGYIGAALVPPATVHLDAARMAERLDLAKPGGMALGQWWRGVIGRGK